jgi:hypothetical protein
MAQLTISNPNKYTTKETENEMVSYHVAGPKALVAKYITVQTAELKKIGKTLTFDDETNAPLFHCTFEKSFQVYENGVLGFSINEEDEEYVFVDTTLYKMQQARIDGCKNPETKAMLKERQMVKDDNFMKLLSTNSQARLAKYIAKNPRTAKTAESAIDDLG